MSGLAGLGDLVLPCTGGRPRNRSVGVELGRGRELPEIISSMHGMVAEGVFTTDAAVQLARTHRSGNADHGADACDSEPGEVAGGCDTGVDGADFEAGELPGDAGRSDKQ